MGGVKQVDSTPFRYLHDAEAWAAAMLEQPNADRATYALVGKKPAGGKRRHGVKYSKHGRRTGRTVRWIKGKFGWDAVLFDSHGHSINSINYGLPNPPTAAQKREAVRAFGGVGVDGKLGGIIASGKRRHARSTHHPSRLRALVNDINHLVR